MYPGKCDCCSVTLFTESRNKRKKYINYADIATNGLIRRFP